jgi:hypothetical protein
MKCEYVFSFSQEKNIAMYTNMYVKYLPKYLSTE